MILHGMSENVLKSLANESVHLTFTSPPYYNAREYIQYDSYEQYLCLLGDIFQEVHRVTKTGRFLVVNVSPVITARQSRSQQSQRHPIPFDLHARLKGWDFIDDIIWVKPEGSAKNRNGGFWQHRKPLAYKPNPVTEYILVYRKHTDKLIDWNVRQYNGQQLTASLVQDGYERTNVWKILPAFDKQHSAIFPPDLCDRIVKYYSFVGDTVLDPFAGSGTLGVVANRLQRNYILIEAKEIYIQYMKERGLT